MYPSVSKDVLKPTETSVNQVNDWILIIDDRNQVLQEMITDDHNQVPQEMPSTEEKPHLGEPQIPSLTSNQTEVKTRNCGHRAGFDAFMTGYCLATYLVQCGSSSANETALGLSTTEFSNKVSLSGKEVPLQIICSHFARPSAAHTEKLCKAREVLGITTWICSPPSMTWLLCEDSEQLLYCAAICCYLLP